MQDDVREVDEGRRDEQREVEPADRQVEESGDHQLQHGRDRFSSWRYPACL
jgi:hypothetical protein